MRNKDHRHLFAFIGGYLREHRLKFELNFGEHMSNLSGRPTYIRERETTEVNPNLLVERRF